MKTYGYTFIPSGKQDDDRLSAFTRYGVSDENMMTDHSPTERSERSAYWRLLQRLQPGDTLVIDSLVCLDNCWAGIAEQFRMLTEQRGVRVVCLDMPSSTEPASQGMLLQLLEVVAATDRTLTRRRQADGISTAREKGVRFGRAPLKKPKNFSAALSLWRSGVCNSRTAAKKLKVSQNTFLKWAREEENI